MGEKSTTEIETTIPVMVAEPAAAPEDSVTPEQQSTTTAVRSWFESLSPEDGVAAISFRDGPFLASVLTWASPPPTSSSPSPSSESQQTDAHQSSEEGILPQTSYYYLDPMMAATGLKEVETTLANFEERFRDGSTELKLIVPKSEDGVSAAETSSVKEGATSEKTSGGITATAEEGENRKPGESNVLRIRSSDERQNGSNALPKPVDGTAEPEPEYPINPTDAKSNIDVKPETGKDCAETAAETSLDIEKKEENMLEEGNYGTKHNSPSFHSECNASNEIAKNVCVIFPSATESEGSVPYITLHPAFLKKEGTEAIAKTFDEMLQTLSPSASFLSSDLFLADGLDLENGSAAEEAMVLQRLRSLVTSAGNKKDKTSSITSLLVLLIRIEVAVCMAFCAKHKMSMGEKKESTDKATKEPEAATEVAVDAEHRIGSESLSALISNIESFKELSKTLGPKEIRNILAPMVEVGFCSAEGAIAMNAEEPELQNLLVTPFSLLVQLLSDFMMTERPSFENWNTAWKATLRNVRTCVRAQKTLEETAALHSTKDEINEEQVANNTKISEERPHSEAKHTLESENPVGGSVLASKSSDWMDDNNAPVAAASTSANAKKAKKKKSKRKKKKNSGNNTDISVQKDGSPQMPGSAQTTPEVTDNKTDKDDTTSRNASNTVPDKPTEQLKSSAHKGINDGTTSNAALVGARNSENSKAVTADSENNKAVAAEATNSKEEGETAEVIVTTNSFDSDKNAPSTSDDTASTKSESTKPDENEHALMRKHEAKGDFNISRVHDVGTVVIAPSVSGNSSEKQSVNGKDEGESKNHDDSSAADDNSDEWETVEVKGRGNRKKAGRPGGQSWLGGNSQYGSKKSKSKRTPDSRKRNANRKIIKEILSSVLDSVDEEAKKKQQQKARVAKAPVPSTPAWQGNGILSKKEAGTMRDVVVGGQPNKSQPVSKEISTKGTGVKAKDKEEDPSPSKRSKGQNTAADQNTATTVPETVSAVSDARRAQASADRGLARSDSSSGEESGDVHKQDPVPTPAQSGKDTSPPLPTLLSPGNANSSSSSVASSLEAPHASHGHHHTSPANENDVGYHLLDVCNRLTRDMEVFMARRAAALNTRRKERGALLAALQESVSSLWSEHSHVELYGSCATMLDLPSSDLDVVVLGLDYIGSSMLASPTQKNAASMSGSPCESVSSESPVDTHIVHHAMPHYMAPQLNGERVVRLAAELERHPWAVHVKAIPTATVPVVKVLADPSRLLAPQNLSDDPSTQQQSMANSAPPVSAPPALAGPPSDNSQCSSGGAQTDVYQPGIGQPVWRGADVINGLLSLDITFEGPEHGGIGSTEFSSRAVQDVCNETALPAESTPFVQVIMVVKELLAQRRLNEPFSGGLSSYALLLLVLAVVCERNVIREELDRVEQQRRSVAEGDGNSCVEAPRSGKKVINSVERKERTTGQGNVTGTMVVGVAKTKDALQQGKNAASQKAVNQASKQKAAQPGKAIQQPQGNATHKGDVKPYQGSPQGVSTSERAPPATAKKTLSAGGGSWACVAKGNKTDPASRQQTKAAPESKQPHPQLPQKKAAPKKPTSFADAVARSQAKTPSAAPGKTLPVPQAGASSSKQKVTPNSSDPKKTGRRDQLVQLAVKSESIKIGQGMQKSITKDAPNSAAQPANAAAKEVEDETQAQPARKIEADEETSRFNNYSSAVPVDASLSVNESPFPQGFNDVIEVLCSGETTPGKLLMHFLLFYGQHFDAHATAIDISGKHPRDIAVQSQPYKHLSPYIQRRTAGTIDPVTGMLHVDPIVVYDPLEGAENNNVARRCFLWSSVKWVFAQSYMTLSSAVEQNTTLPTTSASKSDANAPSLMASAGHAGAENAAWNGPYNPTDKGNPFDPSSPHALLELLLSF